MLAGNIKTDRRRHADYGEKPAVGHCCGRLPVWTRKEVQQHYRTIIDRGGMNRIQRRHFLKNVPDDSVIIQVSGGTGNIPLSIPRSRDDINNTAQRLLACYLERTGKYPKRCALIGGISHFQTSAKYQNRMVEGKSFSLRETPLLRRYNPEVLSCYPSIIRELLVDPGCVLPELKMIKLGGEKIFRADLKNIFARFPDVFVVEQLGSTEMPAVALRVHTRTDLPRPFAMQTERYSFMLDTGKTGWQPLIVKDRFPNLYFPIPHHYDLGDEIHVQNGQVIDIRRKNDVSFPYRGIIGDLLKKGCTNLHLQLGRGVMLYAGPITLPDHLDIDGRTFIVRKDAMPRLPDSNKLPLVVA